MKKLNLFHILGILFIAISLLSSQFNLLPDFIEGFCIGIGLALTIGAIFLHNHNISRLKTVKMNFLKRCLRK